VPNPVPVPVPVPAPAPDHAVAYTAVAVAFALALAPPPAAAGPSSPPRLDAPTAPGLPSPRRERAATLDLRYRRADEVDAGTIELSARRPIASRWWAEAAIGFQFGAQAGRRAATVTNPRLALGLVLGPRLVATAALALPAASASGDDGDFAAAHAGLAVVDPAPLAPRTTTLAAALVPRRELAKAFVQARLGASLLVPTDGANRLLVHLDVGGGIAVAGPVRLAATLATTCYSFTGISEDFVHRLTLAAQIAPRGVELTAGVAAPLDRPQRELDLFELTLTARSRF
jgi:hypothetical protein